MHIWWPLNLRSFPALRLRYLVFL